MFFGDTPNLVARVQATAEPGTVAITDTASAILGLFVVEDCGAQDSRVLNGRYIFTG
jgi:class 3 adenylate cyclase